jgi:hypothetical protein
MRICVRKVFAFQRQRAKALGARCPKTLAVLCIQRFGSLLQLHPHAHAFFPDAVFAKDPSGKLVSMVLEPPTNHEVLSVAIKIAKAVLGLWERYRAEDVEDDDPAYSQVLSEAAKSPGNKPTFPYDDLCGATCENRVAIIPTDLGKFTVHAGTQVAAHNRAGLERLIRYGLRPPVAHNRLALTPAGKVCYRLAKPYYTGQTELVLEPLAFLKRLAALVPPAGQNEIRFFGLLASGAFEREDLAALVPRPPAKTPTSPLPEVIGDEAKPRRLNWIPLLGRIFKVDLAVCPRCKGPRKIIAAITDPRVVQTILQHLNLPTEIPELAAARAPPQADLFFA